MARVRGMTAAGLVAGLVMGMAGSAAGSDVVVPLGYDVQAGGGSFLGPLSTAARRYQMLIHEDQLVGVVGQSLTGLAVRPLPSATVAWPANTVNMTDYTIHLGPSVAPELRSLTFADNEAGPQTQVRTGPLEIAAGSYAIGSSPQPFGPTIEFSQPFAYTGGHLLINIQHSGTGTSLSNDAIAASSVGLGYGTMFSAAWASGTAPLTGSQGNFAIVRISVEGGGPACYANCDESTTEPVLNVADFGCFLTKFAAGDPYANCDESTTEPVLNVADFGCFLTKFAAGCR
jgi:hypothetical protein